MRNASFLLLGLALAACSSSSSPTETSHDSGVVTFPDTGTTKDSGHSHPVTHDAAVDARVAVDGGHDAPAYPAVHAAMAQVKSSGGPVLKNPKFVIVTFAGDALEGSIDDFVAKVAASSTYWSGTTSEYGVGPVASILDLSLNEVPAAMLQDSDVRTWLTQKLQGPDAGTLESGAPWPQPDGETVYMIYYPSSTTISEGGGTSCNQFYGYHDDYLLKAGTYVTYSVVARCPPFPMQSAIDSIASIASHEMIEAVTDPLPSDNPAFYEPDVDHIAWAVPAGGEVGDMCAGYGDVFYYPSDVPYLVQRTWSNSAAAAGHDPCQPAGLTPYYNAAANFPGVVTVNDPNLGMYMSEGVTIPVGGSATVNLQLYSDGATGPFTVTGTDLSALFGGPAQLAITFNGQSMATGMNGDVIPMTIKVLAAGSGNSELVWIQSALSSTQAYQPVWLGVVAN
jgi:hypothetical protein